MPCKLITNQMLFHPEDGFHVTSPGSTLDMVVFHLQGGVSAVLVGAIMNGVQRQWGFFCVSDVTKNPRYKELIENASVYLEDYAP